MGGLNLTLRPEVTRDDIAALEPHQRLEVVRALRALRDCHTDPKGFVVETLGPSRAMLKLDGCLSLKVNCGAAYDSALRIVVLMTGDSLQVLAVGRRQGSKVYQDAHHRLHPPVRPRHRLRRHDASDWHHRLSAEPRPSRADGSVRATTTTRRTAS